MQAAPQDFSFPYKPYTIQEDFMRQLFNVLEEGKLGIFESPTGTGKSLSLICGALTWLQYHEEQRIKELDAKAATSALNNGNDDPDDWFQAAVERRKQEDLRLDAKRELEALKLKEKRMQELRRRRKAVNLSQVQKVESEFDELFNDLSDVKEAIRKELRRNYHRALGEDSLSEAEEDFVLDEYLSDDEGGVSDWRHDNDDPEVDYSIRIFYCSRTHSQLSQFVGEVQKTSFGSSVRLVSLASRANMCINSAVLKLKSNQLINDKCLDLQKNCQKGKGTSLDDENRATKRQKTSGGCPFKRLEQISLVRDQALIQVQDIEQLVESGRQLKGCPYYSSRQAVADAQVVVVPYNTLLHKSTRAACGINLKNSVVIIDEAHNLLDTMASIHSAEVRGSHLLAAHSQLRHYQQRYQSRLKAKNLLYIKQILFVMTRLASTLQMTLKEPAATSAGSSPAASSRMVTIEEFLSSSEFYNISLVKLIQYIDKSKLNFKLRGFTQFKLTTPVEAETVNKCGKKKQTASKGVSAFLATLSERPEAHGDAAEKAATADSLGSAHDPSKEEFLSCPLMVVQAFLASLIGVCSSARILITIHPEHSQRSLKFLLLNPAESHFSDLVSECRAIVVAGGTMQPVDEFKHHLFLEAGASPGRIVHFGYGHVIPEDNILPLVVCHGPTNQKLDFSFQQRHKMDVMDELSRVLLNVCNLVPGGMVCFFPSYEYEARVFEHFEKQGVLQKLSVRKQFFREPRKAADVDKVLKDFGRWSKIRGNPKNGALLFSVVGGKMSEGINFSDDLGRCVMMVGMPFPNRNSPEIQERMAYLDQHSLPGPDSRTPGQVYYENLCMKAVNQCIGRAIRHCNDYATMLLLDHRYSRDSIIKQLPAWIAKCVQVEPKFGPIMPKLKRFFASKQ